MVKVTLFRRRGRGDLTGFEATGHSGYAERGNDIVCAAVSALTTVTVLGLQARLGLSPAVHVDDATGWLRCRLEPGKISPDVWERAQDLLETMALGLKEIAKDYADYVQVEEVAR